MARRTYTTDLENWDDAQDLDRIVIDKRSIKRATPTKGRRRNRLGKSFIKCSDSEFG